MRIQSAQALLERREGSEDRGGDREPLLLGLERIGFLTVQLGLKLLNSGKDLGAGHMLVRSETRSVREQRWLQDNSPRPEMLVEEDATGKDRRRRLLTPSMGTR